MTWYCLIDEAHGELWLDCYKRSSHDSLTLDDNGMVSFCWVRKCNFYYSHNLHPQFEVED